MKGVSVCTDLSQRNHLELSLLRAPETSNKEIPNSQKKGMAVCLCPVLLHKKADRHVVALLAMTTLPVPAMPHC